MPQNKLKMSDLKHLSKHSTDIEPTQVFACKFHGAIGSTGVITILLPGGDLSKHWHLYCKVRCIITVPPSSYPSQVRKTIGVLHE